MAFVVKLGFLTIFSVVHFGSLELSSILLGDRVAIGIRQNIFSSIWLHEVDLKNTALRHVHVAIDGEMEHKLWILMSLHQTWTWKLWKVYNKILKMFHF